MSKTTMEQPDDWLEAVDEAAAKAGISRAEWLWRVGKAALPKSVAKKLTDRPPAHRPRKPKD
jgi:hypothetical protein